MTDVATPDAPIRDYGELQMHVPFTCSDGEPLTEYWPCKRLPSGEWAGVRDLMYTSAIFIGVDPIGYSERFCYATRAEAMIALGEWSGEGDPPGDWIVQKPQGRHGPGAGKKYR